MTQPDLANVLAETQAPSVPLDRFRALHVERDWVHSLVRWLDLEPGATAPTRDAVIARLTLEIASIDRLVSAQLDAILHHPELARLEASWRGLYRLHETRVRLAGNQPDVVRLRVLDLSWSELTRDLSRVPDFEQTQLFRLVYSEEFDQPGGEPFGVLLGDYSVTHRRIPGHKDDVGTLRTLSTIAAASFSPFVAGADPSLFGLDAFADLERPVALGRTFRADEYASWNSLRKEGDSRFIALTLPRVLVRRPYRDDPSRVDGFRYVEAGSPDGGPPPLFGNAVFAFGEVLLRAFVETRWLAAIRGVERDGEGRGLVADLPHDWHAPELQGVVSRGSLEVQLTESQEQELNELGFMPLVRCHGTPFSAFYGNQSIQDWRAAVVPGDRKSTAVTNAKLSSMLQYMFCVSRFAHYVKILVRDKVGSYSSAKEIERLLSDWLIKYATANVGATAEAQAKYPLRDARVDVTERPGAPGVYRCRVDLQPHYQLDQLATSISITTELFTGYEM
ncbi:MAG: type VI secretion system contractile sheath large subunit [Planctomycetota bacterium]